jgi:hypothetical protein
MQEKDTKMEMRESKENIKKDREEEKYRKR